MSHASEKWYSEMVQAEADLKKAIAWSSRVELPQIEIDRLQEAANQIARIAASY